ncbi:ABC transporter ATP-binding protein/permease [Paenibacillus sp. SC116]|uniref:ABC transporter ATP-binding protein n=1 Tax=Paenibacillus sp. SC116 TaxID=2968986 RepID=UPI00215B3894|nr:ABC transporter ATP-binding protein [Paenibacillus sp. SC116]MCR8846414.1 ABC transporter ATP-binding protein/permease [Paenibacillus sp. SC116]
MKRKSSDISNLINIASEKKGLLSVSVIFSVLSSLLQIVPFIAVYNIIKELFEHAQHAAAIDGEVIVYWGIVSLVSLLAALIAIYISAMSSHIAAFHILYQLRVRLADHIAKLPMGYHTKTATGELKKIIEISVEKVEKFIAHQIPDMLSAVIVPLLFIGYLFWLDWRLALALVIPMIVGMWLQAKIYGGAKGQQAYRDYQYAMEEMNATGVEYVRGMPAIKVFGIKAARFLTFKQAVTKYRDISIGITDLYKTPYGIFFIVISSLYTFVIPIGIWLISGDANADSQSFAITFILFLLISPSLSAPVLKLMYVGSGLREIVEGNKRIEAVFSEAAVKEPTHPQVPTTYDVAFHQVTFTYENKDDKDHNDVNYVLKDVNFMARAGEVTALVGPSGGGKSTIAQLLLRFWDVQYGGITIGGVPISEMGTEQLMDTVSFVFQDVHLFYDTIEANIRMGNSTASQSDVIAAAKRACCHEFIEKLEDGYQMKIGEGGTHLSGGEAQRIAIARAILKNAPILVLDEATAYADAENEKKIQQGLVELVKGKTVLIIAHRLSTIRSAEQILVVKKGEIVERGTHDELLGLDGLYQTLWRAHISSTTWKLGLNPSTSTTKV